MTSLDFFHEIYQFFHALRSSGRLQHFPNDPCFSPINLFIFFKSIILDSNIEFVVGSPLCFKRNFSEFCGFSLSSKLKHFKLLFDQEYITGSLSICLFIDLLTDQFIYYDCKVHIVTHNENSGHLQITKALNSGKRSIFNKRNLIVI